MRSKTSLIQTIGRAARNVEGRAILYADKMTKSMQGALGETERRREKQQAYNTIHGITPATVKKSITNILASIYEKDHLTINLTDEATVHLVGKDLAAHIDQLKKRMQEAASNLEFEEAAKLRDQIHELENKQLAL